MSDPLSPPRRASRRRLETNEQGIAPVQTNGHSNGVTKHGPVFAVAHVLRSDRSFVFTWNGLPLTIRYNPDRLSFGESLQFQAMLRAGDGEIPDLNCVIVRLARLIVGWDMVADLETLEPFPVTEDNLRSLGEPFVYALNRAVNEAISPPEP